MSRFDLTAMARRARNVRRPAIVIRDIAPPATLATDLYRAAYLPTIEAWEKAVPGVLAEYERALAQITTDSAADVGAEIDGIADSIDRLILTLAPRLRDWAVRVERWHRSKWRGAVLAATGVDLQTMIGPEATRQSIDAAVAWNTSLIKDVPQQARQRIASAVFSGLTERKTAREVAASIRQAMDMSRRRSMGIASDQLSKLSNALADERRREAGLTIWKWRHSGKKHPREHHKARDGNLYGEGDDIGRKVEGKVVAASPPEDDLPGRPPWCGCRSQSVMVFE